MPISKPSSSNGEKYFNRDHLRSGLKKRAVRGAGATVFSRSTVYCINMISVIILARLLTPDDFGLVAMVTAPFMFLMDFANLGLGDATIQSEEVNQKQISTLFWINTGLGAGLTSLLIAVSPIIGSFYKEPRVQSITIAISFMFVLGGLSTQHLALLKRNLLFYRITANEVIASILSVIIAIAGAWWGWGYWAIVARQLTLSLTLAAGAWLVCSWRPGLPSLHTRVKPMLTFGTNSVASNVTYYFSKNLDKVLIGWCHSTQSLGYYDRAYHLFVLPLNQLSFPLSAVALAALSRLRNEPEKYRRYYLKALSMLAFIGMPLSAIVTLVASDLVLLLLGQQWHKTGHILSIFGLGIGIALIISTCGWLHLSLGRADRKLRWAITTFIVTVIFLSIGLPFGPSGVAIAYTASLYVLVCPALWYAGKPIHLKFRSLLSVIWKPYVCALAAGLLCWFFFNSFDLTSDTFVRLNILARIFLSVILCTSVYLLLTIVLHQGTRPISQFISLLYEMVPNAFPKFLRGSRQL